MCPNFCYILTDCKVNAIHFFNSQLTFSAGPQVQLGIIFKIIREKTKEQQKISRWEILSSFDHLVEVCWSEKMQYAAFHQADKMNTVQERLVYSTYRKTNKMQSVRLFIRNI